MTNTNDPCGPVPKLTLGALVPGTKAWKHRRHVLLCRETFRKVQAIVDGELPQDPSTGDLLAHLDECASCGAEADAVRELKRAIERLGRRDADEIVRGLDPVLQRLLREES